MTFSVFCNADRPNKKINVFLITGLKILGRVGTHIFFFRLSKCIKLYFFRPPPPPQKKKILGFTSKLR